MLLSFDQMQKKFHAQLTAIVVQDTMINGIRKDKVQP